MKRCSKCQVEKEDTEFYVYKKTGKPRTPCKACHVSDCVARAAANPEKSNARTYAWRAKNPGRTTANIRAWQIKNPERFKKTAYKSIYKIDFPALWDAQNGLCACCGLPMLRKGKEPSSVCVDHDRSCCPTQKSCGKCVRGLIHRNCNLTLGYAKDQVAALQSAITYLESWRVSGPKSLTLEPSVLPSLVVAPRSGEGCRVRAWQLRNPERSKAQLYKSRFRIDFKAHWAAQGGLCACCGELMQDVGKDPLSVCVDHDRTCCAGMRSCGKCIRGLIHRNCNLVLGYAKEDIKVLQGAIEYLERWAQRKATQNLIGI